MTCPVETDKLAGQAVRTSLSAQWSHEDQDGLSTFRPQNGTPRMVMLKNTHKILNMSEKPKLI